MLQSLVKSMSLVMLMRGSGIALQLLWFVMLVHLLPMEAVGIYSVVNSCWLLSRALGPVGADSAMIREGGAKAAESDYAKIRGLVEASVRHSIKWNLLTYGVGFAIVYVLMGGQWPFPALLIAAIVLTGIAYLFFTLYSSALLVMEKQIPAHFPESVLLPLSLMGGSFVLQQLGFLDVENLLFMQSVIAALLCGIYGHLYRRALGKSITLLDKQEQVQFRDLSWRMFGTLAFNNLNVRLPVIISPLLIGTAGTAILETAVRFASLLGVIQWCIAFVIAPKLSKVNPKKEPEKLQTLLTIGCWMVFAPASLLFIGFLLLGEWGLELVAGVEYVVAYTPLLIIAFGYLLNTSSGPTTHFYMMLGHERQAFMISAVETVLTLILLLALGHLYGVYGMAIAIAFGLGFRNLWLNLRLYPLMKLHSGIWSLYGWRQMAMIMRQRHV